MSDVTQCQICGNVTTDGRCVCVTNDKPKAAPPREFKLIVDRWHTNAIGWNDVMNDLTTGEEIHVIEYSYAQELEAKCAELEQWKKEALAVFAPVMDFEHPKMKLGDSKVSTLIKFSKERDALESRCQKLEAALQTNAECGNCGGCRSLARQALAHEEEKDGL